jgi:hypothetical protein
MLSICSEFERIARVVLDKTDKDAASRRRKRQQDHANGDSNKTPGPVTPIIPQHNPLTPQPSQPGNIPKVFTPPDLSNYLNEDVGST